MVHRSMVSSYTMSHGVNTAQLDASVECLDMKLVKVCSIYDLA